MTRMETEKAMLEHLIAISDLYADYAPDADCLHMFISNNHANGNGSDFGNWDTRNVEVFSGRDNHKEIKFRAWLDIDNQKYRDAVEKYKEAFPNDGEFDEAPKWEYCKGCFVCLGEEDYE